jgi:DNA-binding MarR family transcriptional regulator
MSGFSQGAVRMEVASQPSVGNFSVVPEAGHEPAAVVNAKRIRHISVLRRLRRDIFTTAYFADAAWDILLALYSAHLDQHRLSIAKLTSRSGVPGTSALRWIGSLEEAGLLSRTPDVTDNRRVFVSLTEQGITSMDSFFGMCGPDIVLL